MLKNTNAVALAALVTSLFATSPSDACVGLDCLNPVTIVHDAVTTVTDAAGNVITTTKNAAGDVTETIKKVGGDIQTTVKKATGDVITTVQTATGDVTETVVKANKDVETTVRKATGDVITTVQVVGGDFTETVQKANHDTQTTIKKTTGDIITTIQIAGGDFTETIQKANKDTQTTLKKASGDIIVTVQVAGGDLTETIQKANGDLQTTVKKAVGDVQITIRKAAGDIYTSLQKAAGDTTVTIQKAGNDYITTVEKGWKDTDAESQRAYKNAVDAGAAIGRYEVRELQGVGYTLSKAAQRLQQGKIVDALWGLGTQPLQNTDANAASLAQESSTLRTVGQIAAGAYGGPEGAAAYAAWYTYHETGDANLALRVGIITGATSAAFGEVNGMPSGGAGNIAKKAIVGGAIGGLSVAAAGGDKDAIKTAFLMSAGTILVQSGYQNATHHPLDNNSLKASTNPAYCMATVGAECSPPDEAYIRDKQGNILDTEGNPLNNHGERIDPSGEIMKDDNGVSIKGAPQVNVTKTDITGNHVGRWSTEDDHSIAGERGVFMTGVSKIPGMNAMALFHDEWAVSWKMGDAATVSTIIPATVLTYVGTGAPVYEKIQTTFVDSRKNSTSRRVLPGVIALGNPATTVGENPGQPTDPHVHDRPGTDSTQSLAAKTSGDNLILLQPLVNKAFYMCSMNNLSRTVLAVSQNHNGCRVVYQTERGLTTPWRARHDQNYCTAASKQLSTNLRHLGWNCQLQVD